MKYKFKIMYSSGPSLIAPEIIQEGDVVEVVRFRERGNEKYVTCLTQEDKHITISFDALKFCAEEYVEPRKQKVCGLCKHYEKCREQWKKGGLLRWGDYCALYEEESQEPDKPTQESESAKHL